MNGNISAPVEKQQTRTRCKKFLVFCPEITVLSVPVYRAGSRNDNVFGILRGTWDGLPPQSPRNEFPRRRPYPERFREQQGTASGRDSPAEPPPVEVPA